MQSDKLSPLEMTEALLEFTAHVNDWEETFLHSVYKQLNNGGLLSGPQEIKLEEIYERVHASE